MMPPDPSRPVATSHGPRNPRVPGLLRVGEGTPLVLLHGVLGGAFMWKHVLPLLAQAHDVVALTALGHVGGTAASLRPARIEHVVDDAERALDALELGLVHLAGNSMGGWVALELCRRGRALSVCALSPAGMWDGSERGRAIRRLRGALRAAAASRGVLPWLARVPAIRRLALRDNAAHGAAVSASDLVELSDAALGCAVSADLLSTPEQFAPLDVATPTVVAWASEDRIFPPEPFAQVARARLPRAQHRVLRGVGHVPMMDDPALVAATILDSVAAAS